jgi:hypothetical protein
MVQRYSEAALGHRTWKDGRSGWWARSGRNKAHHGSGVAQAGPFRQGTASDPGELAQGIVQKGGSEIDEDNVSENKDIHRTVAELYIDRS